MQFRPQQANANATSGRMRWRLRLALCVPPALVVALAFYIPTAGGVAAEGVSPEWSPARERARRVEAFDRAPTPGDQLPANVRASFFMHDIANPEESRLVGQHAGRGYFIVPDNYERLCLIVTEGEGDQGFAGKTCSSLSTFDADGIVVGLLTPQRLEVAGVLPNGYDVLTANVGAVERVAEVTANLFRIDLTAVGAQDSSVGRAEGPGRPVLEVILPTQFGQ